jgi:hypothetical protein
VNPEDFKTWVGLALLLVASSALGGALMLAFCVLCLKAWTWARKEIGK